MSVMNELKNIFGLGAKSSFDKEYALWQEIIKLDSELKKEKSKAKKVEINEEIVAKKFMLKGLNEMNPLKLKYRLEELHRELDSANELNEDARALVRYYESILEKYDYKIIENKTADNLKALITYDSMDIDVILDSLRTENYTYDKDYLKVIKRVYEYAKDEFYLIRKSLSSKFWLEPKDIIKARAGDSLDMAIYICSCMHALGDYNAYVYLVELDDYSTFSFVKTKYKNRVLILDLFNTKRYNEYLGYDDEIMSKYKPAGKQIRKIIYKFNAFRYDSE